MSGKATAKKLTILSAIVSFVSFAYKAGLGFMTMSLVLLIASLSTLMVFIVKVAFIKNVTMTREKKKKAYLVMAFAALFYSLIFILFVVLKVSGIDLSNKKTYDGWLGALLIGFMLVMFILSVIKLKGALEKTDLMVIGLKEMVFVSALSDLVIIEEFVSRIVLQYKEVPWMGQFNSYFCFGAGGFMALVSMLMFVRFFKYEA